jgi:hypothetical protein
MIHRRYFASATTLILCLAAASAMPAENRPRARDLGVPFDGTPGPLNAITDVHGIEVGFTTLVSGEGKLVPGKGPVRTGVTAILRAANHHPATPCLRDGFPEQQRQCPVRLGSKNPVFWKAGDHQHAQRGRGDLPSD